jgi:hypothetical protein
MANQESEHVIPTGSWYTWKENNGVITITGWDINRLVSESSIVDIDKDGFRLKYQLSNIVFRDMKGVFKEESMRKNAHYTAELVLISKTPIS